MSSFASTHVESLLRVAQSAPSTPENEAFDALERRPDFGESPQTPALYPLLLQLRSPLDKEALRKTLLVLHQDQYQISSREDLQIRATLERKIVAGLYAEALDQFLSEARDADSEAEWWDGITRSSRSVAWYFVATLPQRLARSLRIVLDTLREHDVPIRPSSFSPRSLRELFPRTTSLRPTALGTAFFPHLARQPRLLFFSPLELTRQECQKRRDKLYQLRDTRALELGHLLRLKSELEDALAEGDTRSASARLRKAVHAETPDSHPSIEGGNPITELHYIAFDQLSAHSAAHSQALASLRRPSRLTLLWPRLALMPPAMLLIFRTIYNSRESIIDSMLQVHDTLKGFWFGYVIEPVREILDTVRTGGEDAARIVNREAVRADIESLERMAVDLAKDRLSLSNSQVRKIAQRIHEGDFSPVLRIYEDDMKAPVRKALAGTLVRSLLVQIQKAKVDLDRALSGIDRLLKSQELTFAFVGVAPALAIIYASYNGIRSLWIGGRGSKKFGGRREREGAWLAVRRVEHILITSTKDARSPSTSAQDFQRESYLPPVTSGLLLIAVARLREFAEQRLPPHSLLRSGMLDDITDLESPDLGREEKLRVVDRMWRSWGKVFGWDQVGML